MIDSRNVGMRQLALAPTWFALALSCLALFAPPACATDVTLVGLIGSKAIVAIDGGAPRTLAPGQKTA